ncbi:hypothetical protein FQR65_LT10686 [Abscondita terminalis]|nr:hypothetical protein FQR65_LT10686 [Abscondita terminalis]
MRIFFEILGEIYYARSQVIEVVDEDIIDKELSQLCTPSSKDSSPGTSRNENRKANENIRAAGTSRSTDTETAKTSTNDSVNNDTERKGNENEWKPDAVLLLISKYKDNKTELEKKNSVKKHIWKRITDEINEFGYAYTWDQIQNKWKSLIRTYKNVRDNNNESGRNRKTWQFFNELDELFAKNPTIEPPVFMHNGNVIVPKATSSTARDEGLNDDRSTSSSPVACKKRKRNNSEINDLLQLAIEQNQKHHEEELNEKRRFNNLLERIVQCMENR